MWSFNPALADDKDKVRFYIGDVDTDYQLLEDETIEAILVGTPDVLQASVACCRALSARYSKLTSISGGEDSADLSRLQEQFKNRADELTDFAETGGGTGASAPAYLGGVSYAEQQTRLADTDRIPPLFDQDLGRSTTWGYR